MVEEMLTIAGDMSGPSTQTAGARMTTRIPIVRSDTTLGHVHALLWKHGSYFDSLKYVYVVDDAGKLVGLISSKGIFGETPGTPVEKVMEKENLVTVLISTDQEAVTKTALANHQDAVAVVDAEGVLRGAISARELLSILYEEAREDLAAYNKHELEPKFDSVLEVSLYESVKNRIPWIIIGLFGGILAASIVASFEEVLAVNLALFSFIPLAVYLSGAVSAQLQLFYVRDLALYPDLPFARYISRSAGVVVALAVIIGILLFAIMNLTKDGESVAHVVSLGTATATLSALLTGILVPLILARIVKDPANATAPIATIVNDTLTLLIFFTIAKLFLI